MNDKRQGYIICCLCSILLLITSYGLKAQIKSDSNELNIYIIRHAQTIANETKVYNTENRRQFSKNGKRQIDSIFKNLSPYNFDEILVSPTYRTIHTILPYLENNNKTGTIWPELAECCWQENRDIEPSSSLIKGSKIIINDDLQPYFSFRDSSSVYKFRNTNYADGIVQIKIAYNLIKTKYFDRKISIVIISHRHAGSRLMEMFLDMPPYGTFELENAKLNHLKQNKDGSFQLIRVCP